MSSPLATEARLLLIMSRRPLGGRETNGRAPLLGFDLAADPVRSRMKGVNGYIRRHGHAKLHVGKEVRGSRSCGGAAQVHFQSLPRLGDHHYASEAAFFFCFKHSLNYMTLDCCQMSA